MTDSAPLRVLIISPIFNEEAVLPQFLKAFLNPAYYPKILFFDKDVPLYLIQEKNVRRPVLDVRKTM